MKFIIIVAILSAIGIYCAWDSGKEIKTGLKKSSSFYVEALGLND